MVIKRGKPGVLPVTTNTATWDRVTWTVLDQSDSQIFKRNCQGSCKTEMFGFSVNSAGVYRYLVDMEKEGESMECGNKLVVFGEHSIISIQQIIMHNYTPISN